MSEPEVSTKRGHVFLSYARKDNEPFVERLRDDLIARGQAVWWDRKSMQSRGRTLLVEIRDAIEKSERVIAVIGPNAVMSEYVRVEWDHAMNFCKGVLPILREGDYSLVPDDIGKLHCVDFRETCLYDTALDELLEKLAEPVPPMGTLTLVPALPPHYLPRPEDMDPVAETVLADVQRPVVITSAQQTSALVGMGGVGKSVLAAAFARMAETRRAFIHGVIWLTIGQNPSLFRAYTTVGTAFGDSTFHYSRQEDALPRLSKVLAEKNCLIVLDDVWNVADASPFRNALGPNSKLLVTTRDGRLVTALAATRLSLDVLTDEASLRLLSEWSDQKVVDLPTEAEMVAKECGNLPLALAMTGAMVRGNPDRWENVLQRLRTADLEKIAQQFPDYPYPNLLRAIQVSVDALPPEMRTRYLDLAVFPEDTSIPEAVLATFWQPVGLTKYDTQDVVDALIGLSLARRENAGQITIHDLQRDYVCKQVPDLVGLNRRLLDAYRRICPEGWSRGPEEDDGYYYRLLPYHLNMAGELKELRDLLLDYDWLQAQLITTGLWKIPSDEQFYSLEPDAPLIQKAMFSSMQALRRDANSLPSQLIGRLRGLGGPRVQELLKKASNGPGKEWLCPQTRSLTLFPNLPRTGDGFNYSVSLPPKCHRGPVSTVIALSKGRFASISEDGTIRVWNPKSDKSTVMLGQASRITSIAGLGGNRIVSGSEDGAVQIWDIDTRTSKFLTCSENEVDVIASVFVGNHRVLGFTERKRFWDTKRRRSEFFTGRAFLDHQEDPVRAVATSDNGHLICSLYSNKLLVWRTASSECWIAEGMSAGYPKLFVLPDGRVVSSDWHKELRVWAQDGLTSIHLRGHRQPIMCATAFDDGRLVSGCYDGEIWAWDTRTGERTIVMNGHEDAVTSLAALPDGRLVSAARDNTIRLWDDKGSEIRAFEGHTRAVTALAVLNDRHVVSNPFYWGVTVWNVETGREVAGFLADDAISAIATDGDLIAAGSQNGAVHFLELKE